MKLFSAALRRLVRTLVLLTLVAGGTIVMMRFAPGYFADAREMDARYAAKARSELQMDRVERGSVGSISKSFFFGVLHGDMGQSREYGIPVTELIIPRLQITFLLLVRGLASGWVLAMCSAVLLGPGRSWAAIPGMFFTLLLAIPTGAMATLCLLASTGGPVLVLTLLLAARDFKFLHRLLKQAWIAPHVLQARAQGLTSLQLVRNHILPNILPNLLALASLSMITALSALVPLEVVFDVHGVGQLAWSAAMNRDLPVLVAITLLMATIVAVAGMYSERAHLLEAA